MPCPAQADAAFSYALIASVFTRHFDESEVLEGTGERPNGSILLSETSSGEADMEGVLLFRRPIKSRDVRYKASVMCDIDVWRVRTSYVPICGRQIDDLV